MEENVNYLAISLNNGSTMLEMTDIHFLETATSEAMYLFGYGNTWPLTFQIPEEPLGRVTGEHSITAANL